MSLSISKRWRIFERDEFTCRYCGRKAPNVVLEVDHIHPRSRGGSDDPSNLVTACETCNGGKSDRPLSLMPEWKGERLRAGQFMCFLLHEVLGDDALRQVTAHQLTMLAAYDVVQVRRHAWAVREAGIPDAIDRWNRFIGLCGNPSEATG